MTTEKLEQERIQRATARVHEVSDLPIYRNRASALLTDLYQLTMMYGHFKAGKHHQRVVFDMFYRTNPSGNGYVIAAGLEQVVWFIHHLRFHEEDLAYLRSLDMFSEEFLEELASFRFTGDVYAVPEGTIVFPLEPLVRVEGPIFEVQLIESALLAFINHQSLIATKAQRIVDAAGTAEDRGAPIIEMGLRRAQNMDASVFGARAAFIGGCMGTSNVMAGECFGIPVMGTMGHSWVQSFPSELDSFRAYAAAFPDNTVLLIDTYDVLKSGLPHAIQVARELEAQGKRLAGVRIDSGDIAYLSKRIRRRLDEADLAYVGIVASSDLDEWTIRDLVVQGARITSWGVGTKLITSYDTPALGGVYKLVAEEQNGVLEPRIKISENAIKVTNPGKKKVIRFYVEGEASADLIALTDETFASGEPLELFDPVHTYKRKVIQGYELEELLQPIFVSGELIYELPKLQDIRNRVVAGLATFSSENLRHVNPHTYHVDLSPKLWELKHQLLRGWRP